MVKKKKKESKKKGKPSDKVRFYVINFIRVILVFSLLMAYLNERWLILIMAFFSLGVTVLPGILRKYWKINIPAEFEIMTILFIYGLLLFADANNIFRSNVIGILLNLFAAVAVGFIGLTIMYSLYKEEKINASPFVIAVFAFSFSVAFGVIWEIFEFSLDGIFGFSLQKSSNDTMMDLFFNSVGALVVATSGYFFIKKGKNNIISRYLTKFIEKNPKFFKANYENSRENILNLISKGEGNNIEFKSTLRTNIHTNEFDKKIEHATLKTICGYLNTEGGTLLIGVNDDGKIIGNDKDNFQSQDKLNLHFTNLLKNHIGSEYLPFISFNIIPINEKSVLKIDCNKSDKQVFLNMFGTEEFYVRNGASTSKLEGSSLVNYVSHNFNRSRQ